MLNDLLLCIGILFLAICALVILFPFIILFIEFFSNLVSIYWNYMDKVFVRYFGEDDDVSK